MLSDRLGKKLTCFFSKSHLTATLPPVFFILDTINPDTYLYYNTTTNKWRSK